VNEAPKASKRLVKWAAETGFSLPPRRRSPDYLTPVAVAGLSMLALVLLVRAWSNLVYPYPLDFGEGTVLSTVNLIARGGRPYGIPDRAPWVLSVYNPLYLYLAAAAVRVFGASPAVPRALSLLFFGGSVWLVFAFVRRETGLRSAALVAALFLAVERHLVARAGFAVVDFGGLFFSLLGLYLWRGTGGRRWWALAVFALAFFTKQTSLVVAAACFSALFLEGRRWESVRLFGVFAVLLAAGLGLCGLAFGRAYFVNAYRYVSSNPFSVRNALAAMSVAAFVCAVPLAGWVWLAVRSLRERRLLLPVAYVFFSFAAAFATGKEGSNRAYFFDFAAALSIVAGLLWAKLAATRLRGALPALAAVPVVAQLFLCALGALYNIDPWGESRAELLRDASISAAYESAGGLVLSRQSGFDLGTGAQAGCNDLYQLRYLIEGGILPAGLVTDELERKAFRVVVVPHRERVWSFFDERRMEALERNYSLAWSSASDDFYLPQEELGP